MEYKSKGSPVWIEAGRPEREAWTFDDLPQGETYEFRCAAYNCIGTGEFAQYDKSVGIGGGKLSFTLCNYSSEDQKNIFMRKSKTPFISASCSS